MHPRLIHHQRAMRRAKWLAIAGAVASLLFITWGFYAPMQWLPVLP